MFDCKFTASLRVGHNVLLAFNLLADMPYHLADEWFEAKLNSVSLSFQRQIMGKGDDTKKGQRKGEKKSSVDSPATRSRKTDGAQKKVTTHAEVHATPSRAKSRSASSKRDSDVGSEADSAASKVKLLPSGLDIPYTIQTMMARVAKGERPDIVVQDMPVTHKLWRLKIVRNHVKNMKVKLTDVHWQALGFPEQASPPEEDPQSSVAKKRKKSIVGQGDEPDRAETASGADKEGTTSSTPLKTEREDIVQLPATPVVPPGTIAVERVGENLYVQDGRGNLIRLYTTPPPAASLTDKDAPSAAYLTPLGPSSSSKIAEDTGTGKLSLPLQPQ